MLLLPSIKIAITQQIIQNSNNIIQITQYYIQQIKTKIKQMNLLKHLPRLSRNLCIRSQYQFSQSLYNQQVLNKLIVTRTQSQKYSLYLPAELTILQFKDKLKELYPKYNIGITSDINYMMNLGSKIDQQKQKKDMQEIGNVSIVDALIFNRVVVYEKGETGELRIVYGLEIAQYNMSNRLNIPQYIEQAVAQLNYEWSQFQNIPISKALAYDNIRKYREGTLTTQKGQLQQNRLTPEEQYALNQSITRLIKIKQFNEQIGPYLPSTNKLMRKILAYLSVNWVFLFYLTYGKYGWDVGEPVSYLTGLSVDLIAMMGLFQANSALTTQKEKDKQLIETVTNLKANERMAKWRVAYLTRKLTTSS